MVSHGEIVGVEHITGIPITAIASRKTKEVRAKHITALALRLKLMSESLGMLDIPLPPSHTQSAAGIVVLE